MSILLNVVLTVAILGVTAWLILWRVVRFGWWTRFSLCLTASGLLLMSVERVFVGTPFADWAHLVVRVGLLLFLIGLGYGGVRRAL